MSTLATIVAEFGDWPKTANSATVAVFGNSRRFRRQSPATIVGSVDKALEVAGDMCPSAP